MDNYAQESFEKKQTRTSNEAPEDEGDYDEQQTSSDGELEGNPDLKDLSRTKLTNKEYLARAQSAKVRKGKYGVTVPKPFGFDTRDKKKAMTIREMKVEAMVQEKRIEEDNLVKHQFRSKPIPPEVLIPKYQTIMEAETARRNMVRSQSMAINA